MCIDYRRAKMRSMENIDASMHIGSIILSHSYTNVLMSSMDHIIYTMGDFGKRDT